MVKCIWCLKQNAPHSEEHIIPEALGCPGGFVLSGGVVCRKCNNDLARLDRAIIDDFDFFLFMSGVRRKGGRPPAIRSRGNVVGTFGPQGPVLFINMDRQPMLAHDGIAVGGFGGSSRNVSASIERDGSLGKVSFSVEMGRNPQFIRGIVKIAVSTVAYFFGPEVVLSAVFDPVRKFVRKGRGGRKVLFKFSGDNNYANEVIPPRLSVGGNYVVRFRLACVDFCVDLSPDNFDFYVIKATAAELYGEDGWACLPPAS